MDNPNSTTRRGSTSYLADVITVLNTMLAPKITDTTTNHKGISFKPNTDLSIINTFLLNQVSPQKEITSVEDLTTVSKNILSAIHQDSQNPIIGSLYNIGVGLASNLAQAFVNIKETINPEVEHLTNKVQQKYTALIKEQDADLLLGGSGIPDTSKFILFQWNGINTNSYIDTLHNLTNLKKPKISLSNLKYITLAINKLAKEKHTDVDLPEEYITLLQDSYSEISSSLVLTEHEYTDMINSTLTKQGFTKFFGRITSSTLAKRISTNQIIEMVEKSVNYIYVIDQIIKMLTDWNVSDELRLAYLENLEHNRYLVQTMKYCVRYFKDNIYKDTVLLTNIYINGPVYKKLEAKGKNLKDIALVLKVVYSDKLPLNGIKVNIFDNKYNENLFEVYNKRIKAKSKVITTNSLLKAFSMVTKSYFSNIAAIMHLDKESDEREYSKRKRMWNATVDRYRRSLHGKIEKVENILYDMLIEFLYSGTITETVYQTLNSGYESLMDDHEQDTITDTTILNLEVDVLSTEMLNYLIDNFVEIN